MSNQINNKKNHSLVKWDLCNIFRIGIIMLNYKEMPAIYLQSCGIALVVKKGAIKLEEGDEPKGAE